MSRIHRILQAFYWSESETSITKLIKTFAVKVGLATVAVYYIKQQGVWKSSDESVKTLAKLKDTCKPYVNQLKNQIPVELPQMPETNKISVLAKEGWNEGVLATFKFVANLPETVSSWSDKSIDAMFKNPEMKSFVESFSNKNNSAK